MITFNDLPEAVTELFGELKSIRELLSERTLKPQPEADHLLTIQQVADLLHIAVPTVYGLVSRKEIPHMKKCGRLYFSKSEITEWIKASRKKTLVEIEADTDNYLSSKKPSL